MPRSEGWVRNLEGNTYAPMTHRKSPVLAGTAVGDSFKLNQVEFYLTALPVALTMSASPCCRMYSGLSRAWALI